MIVKIGNIFESKCTTIVNTINCVGVMGKGIALEFKKKYPDMFMEYVLKCDRGEVKPGIPYFYQKENISILNFPTKDHWRSPSRLSYVIDGLDWFIKNYEKELDKQKELRHESKNQVITARSKIVDKKKIKRDEKDS